MYRERERLHLQIWTSTSTKIVEVNMFLCLFMMTMLLRGSALQRSLCSCTSEDDKHSLRFLGFFPCSPDSNRDLNKCDILTMSAVELAIRKINQDTNILSCFKLELLPVFTNDPIQDSPELFQILAIARRYTQHRFHGVLGPYHASIAKSIAYICGKLNILQMSYSITDPSLEDTSRYPTFYTIVPDDHFLNKVRQELLEHFGWKRVGIFSVDDEYHVSASELLSNYLKSNEKNMTVFDLGSFQKSPEKILMNAKFNDVRVFLPLFGESYARSVLCVAYHFKLTTADHVWILPGIYNTKWWYLEDNDTTSNCTNEQILEAINSTLFVDTFPFNINMKSEVDDVLSEIFYNIVLNISANMTMEEYSSLVIHSKLLNAYDATTALALTWNASLSKIENEFLNDDIFSVIDNPWYHPHLGQILQDSLENIVSPYNGLAGFERFLRSDIRLNFSQGLITQLTGQKECILKHVQLLLQESQIVCTNNTNCCNDSWKGGYLPSDGSPYICSFMRTGFVVTMVIMGIWYIFGIGAGLALLVITFICKENKHIKATSPKFNIILNLSCCGMFVNGLLLLAIYYLGITGNYGKTVSRLCDAGYSIWHWSITLFFSALLLKNWQIYRVFYNPRIRNRKYLSDGFLLLRIFVMTVPVTAIIITKLVIRPFYMAPQYTIDDCPDANAQNSRKIEYYCTNQFYSLWFLAINIYVVILFIAILVLALYNTKIISYFKKEGEVSSLLIVIATFGLLLFSFTVNFLFTSSISLEYSAIFWTSSLAFQSTFLLAGLYLPRFIVIARDKKTKHKSSVRETLCSLQTYLQKCDEINKLKSSLLKINTTLATLSSE